MAGRAGVEDLGGERSRGAGYAETGDGPDLVAPLDLRGRHLAPDPGDLTERHTAAGSWPRTRTRSRGRRGAPGPRAGAGRRSGSACRPRGRSRPACRRWPPSADIATSRRVTPDRLARSSSTSSRARRPGGPQLSRTRAGRGWARRTSATSRGDLAELARCPRPRRGSRPGCRPACRSRAGGRRCGRRGRGRAPSGAARRAAR